MPSAVDDAAGTPQPDFHQTPLRNARSQASRSDASAGSVARLLLAKFELAVCYSRLSSAWMFCSTHPIAAQSVRHDVGLSCFPTCPTPPREHPAGNILWEHICSG